MSPRVRIGLFCVAVLVLLPAIVHVAAALPAFGTIHTAYGSLINHAMPDERHISNMVTAVMFDVRGFDTVGEEFMLVAAVTGAVVLLRGERGEDLSARPAKLPDRPVASTSPAVMLMARLFTPIVMVFGANVALHSTVTPGGGFQGGAIMASGALLVWVGQQYRGWRTLIRARVLDVCEGGGALGLALCGLAPMLVGARFLENRLPYGQFRDMLSGGLIQLSNGAATFAVAGGFLLLFVEFLEETREPKDAD